jgi:hypothetical protein
MRWVGELAATRFCVIDPLVIKNGLLCMRPTDKADLFFRVQQVFIYCMVPFMFVKGLSYKMDFAFDDMYG